MRLLDLASGADYNWSMEKKEIFYMAWVGISVLLAGHICMAADAQPRTSWGQEMRNDVDQDVKAAEKEMQKAGRELEKAADDFGGMPGVSPAQSLKTSPAQTTSKKPLSNVQRHPVVMSTKSHEDPRGQALQGSPETGYAGTWKDPATGDIMTSVIAPAPRQDNVQQAYPIIVEPQVSGSGWYQGNSGWAPVWNGSGSGWQQPPGNWPQWPGYPGDSGYLPPPPPPPAPNMRPVPPGVPPNQPYNPDFPTYNPYNPSWTPFPPPEHPGYRPLRPNNPSIWKPGQPWNPGQPGQNTGPGQRPFPSGPGWGQNTPPPNNNGFNPVPGRPAPGWTQGQHGHNPGHAPGFRPLPMRPGGQTWGGGTGAPQPGGFGGGF